MNRHYHIPVYRLLQYSLCVAMLLLCGSCYAQTDSTRSETDVVDIYRKLFRSRSHAAKPNKSTIAFLPAVGYNPSIGFQMGVNFTGGMYLGDKKTTNLSIGALGGYITTKGIVSFQFRHNVFTEGNRWNFQGNWQIAKIVTLDYGVGTGIDQPHDALIIYGIPTNYDSTVFPIQYRYIRFFEKAYKEVAPHFFIGAGASIDMRSNIKDKNLDSTHITPHYTYSTYEGFNTTHYNANGFLLNVQYNTRDQLNRPYHGTYADLGIRVNETFIGSSANAIQLLSEFREYIPLSHRNPSHVLAFWYWGNFLLSGKIPYLELPGTGSDMFNRSGRGYTIGRFKGKSFAYAESEYRFPISQNGFVGGVVFANVQSGTNNLNSGFLEYWEPAAGAGLRFLFNKNTRTNICIDYAVGRFGSNGFFLGLNEAF
ncbi:BamA/TamA family outer membrane protein [Deminuibacter soli]|uniref:Bacterial surface antigen (D15) domain-containing protein n=1 Tax=Deminuibacter soli TaxID=2291815 RepID=A0A3E1NH93_9BACT|nr:BamA/TamA family outer membrane protein [Deminuibacter soli]RFM27319.1 hypothetical protein DXN05_14925 [Deminuibacter soli]